MVDPYPTMDLEYALKALRIRFGKENVRIANDSGHVTIPVEHPGIEGPVLVTLTAQQAKYLALNPIDSKDIVEGKLYK